MMPGAAGGIMGIYYIILIIGLMPLCPWAWCPKGSKMEKVRYFASRSALLALAALAGAVLSYLSPDAHAALCTPSVFGGVK
jgi:hypothetical protein